MSKNSSLSTPPKTSRELFFRSNGFKRRLIAKRKQDKIRTNLPKSIIIKIDFSIYQNSKELEDNSDALNTSTVTTSFRIFH